MDNQFQKRPNYLYPIFSVAMVLFLLGFFGTLMIQTQGIIRYFKENVQLIVELKKDLSTGVQDSFVVALKQAPYAQASTVEFTDRETAFEEADDEVGDDLKDLGLGNPYFDVVSFKLDAAYLSQDKLEKVVSELQTKVEVSDIYYQKGLVDDIGQNVSQIGKIGILVSLILVFVAMGIIYSTIKLAIYSNRFLIKNMQLVGATYEFISRPYLIRSIKHGLLAAGVAILLLILVFAWIDGLIPSWSLLRFDAPMLIFFVFLILIGVSLTVFSTLYTVRKHLRANMDDLY